MKVFKKIDILMLLILFTGIMGCSSNEVEIYGNGIIETRAFDLEEFHTLRHRATFPVILVQGPREVVLEGDSNILPWVDLWVFNEELIIGFKQGANLKDFNMVLKVSLPHLQELEMSSTGSMIIKSSFDLENLRISTTGTGDLSSEGLLTGSNLDLYKAGTGEIDLWIDMDELHLQGEGTGSILMKGIAESSFLELRETVGFKGFELDAPQMKILHRSTGRVEVYVREYLEATLSSTGDIFYKGFPELEISRKGTGEVVDFN